MSWLDLPPLEFASSDETDGSGLVRGLVGLVAGGLVGFFTQSRAECWAVADPAALAAVLGVGEVERVDMGQGFAECAHLDRRQKVLQLRNRNPRTGGPRTFAVRDAGLPDRSLDPKAAWQLARMIDTAVRRDERFALAPGGYGDSEIFLGVELGDWQGQRRIIVTARPAALAQRWSSGRLGMGRGGAPSRSTSAPLTTAGRDQAVELLSQVVAAAGVSPWEFMPVFPTA